MRALRRALLVRAEAAQQDQQLALARAARTRLATGVVSAAFA